MEGMEGDGKRRIILVFYLSYTVCMGQDKKMSCRDHGAHLSFPMARCLSSYVRAICISYNAIIFQLCGIGDD